MSFVSYAQNGEDVLLNRVFGGQYTGFYVDVGAYHPVNGSVTKTFYDRGWSGINVEPGSVFDELAAARPRDVNLRMAVLDRAGAVRFIESEADAGTSHVLAEGEQAEAAREVPCDTLEAIVHRHGGSRPVDFLKVDAEGAERAIVASTNWRRFRPRVLVFEATLPWSSVLSNGEWEPTLLEGGYVRVFFDGINCYYVPEEEHAVIEQHFRVPVNVLDRVVPYALVEADRKAAEVAERAAAAANAAAEEATRLREEVNTAKAGEADRLRAALEEADRLRAALEEADRLRAALEEADRLRAALEEADRLRAALEEADRLRAALEEADRLRAALEEANRQRGEFEDAVAAERASAALARAEAEARLAEERQGRATLAATLQEIQAVATVPPAPPQVPRFVPVRRLARAAYGVVRPVVRPIMHRMRNFLMHPQVQALDALRGEVQRVHTAGALVQVPALPPPATLAEMRRLAAEVERAVLTLAMEGSGAKAWPAEEAASSSAPLSGGEAATGA